MSNSVFVPKSSTASQKSDNFSVTSSVPDWTKVSADAGVDVLRDINALLSEVRRNVGYTASQAQAGGNDGDNDDLDVFESLVGGAKKRGKKSASKGKKTASKSKKASSKKAKTASRPKAKKAAKADSKTKKGSKGKKGSKRQSGGMPKFMEDLLKIKAHVKKDSSIKDGPALSKVISAYLKTAGSVDKAIDLFDEKKKSGAFKKAYDEANQQMAEKRAAKKAAKN
jgi:hypothetical protein